MSAIYFNKSKKSTGFADENGFAYFSRKKSRASLWIVMKLDKSLIRLCQDSYFSISWWNI